MKTFSITKYIFLFFTATLLFNCAKSEELPEDIEVHDFVWRGLNAWYLWQDEVPDLQDDRFGNQSQLNSFLDNFNTPRELFESLIVEDKDKFSFIVEDFTVLENNLNGISLSNGMEFGIESYENGSNNVYGYVRYVVPNSDAAAKGITRGMIFNTIDGTQLTSNNARELLSNTNTSFTVGFANFNNGNPTANGTTVFLNKTALTENPVAISKVINRGGTNIGYLQYNQFSAAFDSQLNTAFGDFKAQGITELIVDLRYNPGGSVRTAGYLGSMITGQFNNELFVRKRWNSKVEENITSESFFIDNFTDRIRNTDRNGAVTLDEPINSLNLTRVFFIITDKSASASELVINSLRSYIDVSLVGTTTTGKIFGSITLFDSKNLTRNGDDFNKNHSYALQPLVSETVNKDDENAPNGFTPGSNLPGTLLFEDKGNLGILGDETEPLLAAALNLITGNNNAILSKTKTSRKSKELFNSKSLLSTGNNMYVDFK